jgi:hypothetical protein
MGGEVPRREVQLAMRPVRTLVFVGAVTTALGSLPSVAIAVTANQLVYAFTYSSVQDVYARDSQNPAEPIDPADRGGSGTSHYHGGITDRGTMTLQALHQQPDGSLVLMISEQGENLRRAPPAECVVESDTNVLCDPNKTVYPEEYTLLRFLGRDFVDPSQLDAHHHWAIKQDSGGLAVHADYVVNSANNGKMQITETRSLRQPGGGSLTTDIQTKIGYDLRQSLPTSIDEYATQRHDNGVTGTTTTVYQTTLSLVQSTPIAEPQGP